ncbi:SubName: Full=Uncharacterized protein {ECO:0000313/EMBL:CCA68096.1} [Serendipita indica DSM 11827]|uniref:Uncharacterized protein n=1 Tax=Serendipita indica (strain DSM 11827) TaxID=1109443 RepID=G4T9U3_SERID|nr:SubName: Full=Uncharacterized protein {ECO:0000313/EMBL:CCA68096.1} [Serendipita indica DSM 11827]CCA68096.1 hypothetical protein PIIN_01964 [Serendipita indica DSM 11827]
MSPRSSTSSPPLRRDEWLEVLWHLATDIMTFYDLEDVNLLAEQRRLIGWNSGHLRISKWLELRLVCRTWSFEATWVPFKAFGDDVADIALPMDFASWAHIRDDHTHFKRFFKSVELAGVVSHLVTLSVFTSRGETVSNVLSLGHALPTVRNLSISAGCFVPSFWQQLQEGFPGLTALRLCGIKTEERGYFDSSYSSYRTYPFHSETTTSLPFHISSSRIAHTCISSMTLIVLSSFPCSILNFWPTTLPQFHEIRPHFGRRCRLCAYSPFHLPVSGYSRIPFQLIIHSSTWSSTSTQTPARTSTRQWSEFSTCSAHNRICVDFRWMHEALHFGKPSAFNLRAIKIVQLGHRFQYRHCPRVILPFMLPGGSFHGGPGTI